MSMTEVLFGELPRMLYSQFFRHPQIPRTDCKLQRINNQPTFVAEVLIGVGSGKTIVVTGANSGLGKEAARHFVRLGASKVILACRSTSKGEEAKRDIEQSEKRTDVCEVWQLDLADYASVKAFADRAKSLQRLDVVLENAGVNTQKFKMVAGNEMNLTVNVIGTFFLLLLLLPKLRSHSRTYGSTPTLTVVTSELHSFTAFNERKEPHIFDSLNDEKKANMSGRYPLTKLFEILAVREIAREHSVEQLGCTLDLVNPGWCHSELAREIMNPAVSVVTKIMCRSTEVGARTLVDAAVGHGTEVHGEYLSNQKIGRVSTLVSGSEGPETQKRVWLELAEKLEEIQPGILKNLDS